MPELNEEKLRCLRAHLSELMGEIDELLTGSVAEKPRKKRTTGELKAEIIRFLQKRAKDSERPEATDNEIVNTLSTLQHIRDSREKPRVELWKAMQLDMTDSAEGESIFVAVERDGDELREVPFKNSEEATKTQRALGLYPDNLIALRDWLKPRNTNRG